MNKEVIDDNFEFGDLGGNDERGCLSSSDNLNGTNRSSEDSVFTMEEEVRFAIRFEEGYDLIDPKYEARLRIHNPESAGKVEMSKSPVLTSPSKVTDSPVSISGLSKHSSLSLVGPCIDSSPSNSRSGNGIPNKCDLVTPKSNSSLMKSVKRSPLFTQPSKSNNTCHVW